ncbi:hypothetical protein [Bradyrhizobium liaoningense]
MNMTDSQRAFLRLHQCRIVERTQAIFQGAMVRATSDRGEHATVSLDELEDLVHSGLLAPAWGGAFTVTEMGRGI